VVPGSARLGGFRATLMSALDVLVIYLFTELINSEWQLWIRHWEFKDEEDRWGSCLCGAQSLAGRQETKCGYHIVCVTAVGQQMDRTMTGQHLVSHLHSDLCLKQNCHLPGPALTHRHTLGRGIPCPMLKGRVGLSLWPCEVNLSQCPPPPKISLSS
jgi:hypothetical protein